MSDELPTEPLCATSEPLVVIGDDRTASPPLHSVIGAVRLANGVVALANAGTYQVLLFRADGTFWKAVGRQGSGPGEYQGLNWLGRADGDTLLLHDHVRNTITVLGDTGAFIRSFQLEKYEGRFATRPVGLLSDGSLVMAVIAPPVGVAPSSAPVRFRHIVVRYSRDGRMPTKIVERPGDQFFVQAVPPAFGGVAYWDLAFGRRSLAAPAYSGIYVVDTGELEVQTVGFDGQLRRILRFSHVPVRLTPTDAHQYLQDKAANLEGPFRTLVVKAIDEMPIPAFAPAVSSFLVDRSGRLWLQEAVVSRHAPPHWRVFTPRGEYLIRAECTQDAELLSVEEQHVLIIVRGESDEEIVKVYLLPKKLR